MQEEQSTQQRHTLETGPTVTTERTTTPVFIQFGICLAYTLTPCLNLSSYQGQTSGYEKNGSSLPLKGTKAVAAAKSAHLAHLTHAGVVTAPAHHTSSIRYSIPVLHEPHVPLAQAPGYDNNGAPVPVKDTQVVAGTKSAHLTVLARSRSATALLIALFLKIKPMKGGE